MRWAAALCLAGFVCAADGAGGERSGGRFAAEVKQWRQNAEAIRRGFEEFEQENAHFGDFIQEDLVTLKEATEAQAAACERVAEAFARGEPQQAERLKRDVEAGWRAVEVWRRRIGEIRKRQAEATPYESGTIGDFHWMRRGTLNEYWNLIRARRAVAAAWRDLAEATVPGADTTPLNEMWDAAAAAEIHREIAEWRYAWAQRKSEIWSDPRVDSEELREKFAAFEKVLEQRISLRLADIQRDRRVRELEREWREADRQCQEAFDRAREARERAASRQR